MSAVLVTGGAGFIGSHLVEHLVEQGYQVRVLDDFSTGKEENLHRVRSQVEVIRGDVADPQAVRRAVEGVRWVFHLAALASVPRSVEDPQATHQACATGTLVVLEQARRWGVQRVVYAGSSSAYGDRSEGPLQESLSPSPLSPYAAAKLAGEHYCQSFYHSLGLETVVLRYFNVYGPRQDPRGPYAAVIPKFIEAALEDRPPVVFGTGKQSRDFVYVEDVVRANLLAAQSPQAPGGVFNIGSGRSTTLLELLEVLEEVLGRKLQPQFASPRPGDVLHSQADISLAQKCLGYTPRVSLRQGLEQTVEFFARQRASCPRGSSAS